MLLGRELDESYFKICISKKNCTSKNCILVIEMTALGKTYHLDYERNSID